MQVHTRNLACRYSARNSATGIAPSLARCYANHMTEPLNRDEIRRRSFLRLIEKNVPDRFQTQREMADALGFVPAHFSQMKSGNRPIGNASADKIERGLGLEVGALDRGELITKEGKQPLSPSSNTQTSNAPLQSEVNKIGAGELDAVISAVLESHGWTLDEYVAIKRRANAQPKRWEHPDMIEEVGQKTKRSRH